MDEVLVLFSTPLAGDNFNSHHLSHFLVNEGESLWSDSGPIILGPRNFTTTTLRLVRVITLVIILTAIVVAALIVVATSLLISITIVTTT